MILRPPDILLTLSTSRNHSRAPTFPTSADTSLLPLPFVPSVASTKTRRYLWLYYFVLPPRSITTAIYPKAFNRSGPASPSDDNLIISSSRGHSRSCFVFELVPTASVASTKTCRHLWLYDFAESFSRLAALQLLLSIPRPSTAAAPIISYSRGHSRSCLAFEFVPTALFPRLTVQL